MRKTDSSEDASKIAASCSGKHKFEDFTTALAVADRYNTGNLKPYRCDVCGFYHLGNRSRGGEGTISNRLSRPPPRQREQWPPNRLTEWITFDPELTPTQCLAAVKEVLHKVEIAIITSPTKESKQPYILRKTVLCEQMAAIKKCMGPYEEIYRQKWLERFVNAARAMLPRETFDAICDAAKNRSALKQEGQISAGQSVDLRQDAHNNGEALQCTVQNPRRNWSITS